MLAIASPLYNYTFSPFTSKVEELYDVSLTFMTMLSSFGGILSLAMAMFTNYLMDNYGMRLSLGLTALLLITGTCVKLLINQSLWFLLLGNCIAAIGRNVVLNGSPKTANRWFFPKNTPVVTALIIATTPVGVFFGYLIPIIWIDEDTILENGED